MTWMQTASGRKFDLLNPRVDQVDFDDIAAHLSQIARFTGAAGPYSVAQHCVLGADALLAETGDGYAAFLFLLHDAHEFVINDVSTPVKWAQAIAIAESLGVAPEDVRRAITQFEAQILAVILTAAGIDGPISAQQWALVKDMDERMCLAERNHLMGPPPEPWHSSIEDAEPIRLRGKITPWPAEKAREAWLDRFHQWRPRSVTAAEAV